jgi:hypothetical protein
MDAVLDDDAAEGEPGIEVPLCNRKRFIQLMADGTQN